MHRNKRSNHFGSAVRGKVRNQSANFSSKKRNGRSNPAVAVGNRYGQGQGRQQQQQQQQQQDLEQQQALGRQTTNDDAPPPMEATMKCLSVVEEGFKIAFACYDEENNEIILEESRVNGHDTERIIQSFIAATRPNLILISSKIASNAPLLDLLTKNPPPTPLHDDNDDAYDNDNGNGNIGDEYENGNGSWGRGQGQNQGQSRGYHNVQPSIPYQLLKSKAFDIKSCKELILKKLRVMALLKQSSRQQNSIMPNASGIYNRSGGGQTNMNMNDGSAPSSYHALASVVDFDSPVLLRTLGSLLCFLQGTAFRLEENSTITVNTIRYVRSSQYMRIDTATLHALHIFSTEHHPLIAKGPGKGKEGFSLFTLLDRTKSKVGKKCLKEWMMKPLLDPATIKERQDGVELFLKPSCRETVSTLMGHLQKVGAVEKIILRMQKCHSAPMDFIVLSKTLTAAISIFATLNGELRNVLIQEHTNSSTQSFPEEHVAEIREEFAVVDRILQQCHVTVLQDLHERLSSIVDHEATAETKESVVIHYGFHEELDNAKEMFDNLDETLSTVGSDVLQQYPELISVKVVFLPQVGFLIAIDKRNHSHDVATNVFPDLPSDFAYVFIQENEAFFKNDDMRRLDEEIGDLDAFIKDTESMIVSELEEDILDCETELRSTFGAFAILDCLLAFASCAADLNFVRPTILRTGSGIFVENGRHPLQELIVDNEFIPNDTNIDDSRRINVVTGPNFSGKSCYTRQVGVLVYMTHIGCFVPCDSARISLTDQILARISSVETCAVPQSSFQLDLTQMATILSRSTENSLVLIDEFGKGTSPVSGIAVLTAALKKLITIRCKVICTTHFLEIFSLKLLIDGTDSVKVLHMAVHIPDSDDDDDDDDAVPLFKLEDGVAASSAGVICAKMAGVHEDVTSRAREILGALKNDHQVKPIPANLNSNSVFQPAAKTALRLFLGNDSWKDVSREELNQLQQKISMM